MPKIVAAKKPAAKKVAVKKVKVSGTVAPIALPKLRPVKILNVGSIAPNFSMPATLVGEVSRAKLSGKPFLLYFYPKDDTSGCTTEACGFRDSIATFKKLNIPVIGVSRDSLASHEKFAKKYDLNFPLASDENCEVCALFGTWVQKSMYGRTYMGIERSTFLIDGKGIIRNIWRKVKVPGHVDEVIEAIKEL